MLTFGKRIGVGFGIAFLLLLAIGIVAYRGIDKLEQNDDLVDHTHVVMEHIEDVLSRLKDAETAQRGFIITGDEAFLEPFQGSDTAIATDFNELRQLTADNPEQQRRLEQLEPLVKTRLDGIRRGVEMRRTTALDAMAKLMAAGEGRKSMEQIRALAAAMTAAERVLLKSRAADAEAAARGAREVITWGTLACLIFVAVAGVVLTRSLAGQVGTAVRHIQGASAELQSAANQQVTGAKESSTSMNEITTTINELLVSSRQIADSAQRVTGVAEQTVSSARAGQVTVQKTNDSIAAIRRQVDRIVQHMLDLGKQSQQIGSVLDIVMELAEQTNILSINASIEAAGAGENGKRFGVVADEIRKLADRVASSGKEIRILIDEVRGSVNTTVMATETGSKAVDEGARQFQEVTAAFGQIVSMASTTTEAAREIELSTKQQSTAVEQVNLAIAATAQATRETETSSAQTLQTASQLTTLSRDLLRLVQPPTTA